MGPSHPLALPRLEKPAQRGEVTCQRTQQTRVGTRRDTQCPALQPSALTTTPLLFWAWGRENPSSLEKIGPPGMPKWLCQLSLGLRLRS